MRDKKNDKSAPKKAEKSADKPWLKILVGIFTGFINGMFGGGGGMIAVPALRAFSGYKTGVAHATAIAVILPISVLSGAFYTAFGKVEFAPVFFTALGVTVGGATGAFLLKKLKSKWITLIFSAVMAVAGIKMLFF